MNRVADAPIILDIGRAANAFLHPIAVPALQIDDPLALTLLDTRAASVLSPAKKVPASDAQRGAVFIGTPGLDWFEHFHVVPRSFDFGNLLSDQSVPIEVFSAFRRDTHEWTAFVNNAGVGVDLVGLPLLPIDVFGLQGIQMTLDVSTSGDPFVDETLDFFFDVSTILVPIEIQRVVLWGNRPEQEYTEVLSFLTDVQRAKGGSERRPSLRKNPRQFFEFDTFEDEGIQKATLENLLFDWQARTFGVPVWFDECFLTVAASIGALSITVDETTLRDFRVGGLVCIFTSQGVFDVSEITAKTATTISIASPLVNAYVVGTSVFPLRICEMPPTVEGGRYPVGLSTKAIRFRVTDNDSNLANLAPFSTFNGKLLLDRGNSVLSSTVRETFTIEIIDLDNATGVREIGSPWDRHKRGHALSLRAEGRQAVWELRGLVHALRGRQVSFYIVRDSDDLFPSANLLSGSNVLTSSLVGYAQFVRQRQPKNVLRINFASGAAPLFRTVLSSSVPSPGVDELVLDATWPATFTPAEISRIEYVEKVRIDTDDVRIEFRPQAHLAHLVVPIMAVFE